MTDLMKKNLDEQIKMLKYQIQQCNDEKFDNLIYKYNIFNNIKNTIIEGNISIEKFKNKLETDELLLDKLYNRFLNVNINFSAPTFDETMLETFLKEEQREDYPILDSDTYKGIHYSVINDCCENTGGYYIEFFKDLEDEGGEIDFDDRLDYMVIHVDNEDEMKHPKEYVEKYIDILITELENEAQENEDELEG